jgi:hypothetical protein
MDLRRISGLAVDGETDPYATITKREILVTIISPDDTAGRPRYTEEDIPDISRASRDSPDQSILVRLIFVWRRIDFEMVRTALRSGESS